MEYFYSKGNRILLRSISKSLSRDPSVICRELKRNSNDHHYRPIKEHNQYLQHRLDTTSKARSIVIEIKEIIQYKFNLFWISEQISGRLKTDAIDSVCHESIYKTYQKA